MLKAGTEARPAEDDTGCNLTIRWDMLQTLPFPDVIGGEDLEETAGEM